MKEQEDYVRDIAEIRSMMERSSKFLSLSGWAGILAGIFALSGAWIAYKFFGFNPDQMVYNMPESGNSVSGLPKIIALAMIILILAMGTAMFLSYRKALKKGEKIWNPTTRRLLEYMAVPLVSGGLLVLILIFRGLTGLMAPCTLLFYGLALYNAGKLTYEEVKILGFVQIALGLLSAYFTAYGLLIWAFGFGVVHIIYGIYMYFRYER